MAEVKIVEKVILIFLLDMEIFKKIKLTQDLGKK
jgi:hypothetical protein